VTASYAPVTPPATSLADKLASYLGNEATDPWFLTGDAHAVLAQLPDDSVDMCMTSPPYWGLRDYHQETTTEAQEIGQEPRLDAYLDHLLSVFTHIKRVLKPEGSVWLNLGDTYLDKGLMGVPWRTALALIDRQGWILRNDVIWHKLKGAPDNARDKLRNIHEHVFHFVQIRRGYYYDVDAIRSTPKKSRIKNGSVVSATGVTGVRYKRQIELSADLCPEEKQAALTALDAMLAEIAAGNYADFRMVIRGRQRTTHSDSAKISGRARELRDRGFYFLRYHPKGAKPSDVWEVLPEDTHGRANHFAPFPADLCRLPILATCPPGGVVLDPFCGTGTTNFVAAELGRHSIGIDRVAAYTAMADQRCRAAASPRD